jgi:predicted secreted protein
MRRETTIKVFLLIITAIFYQAGFCDGIITAEEEMDTERVTIVKKHDNGKEIHIKSGDIIQIELEGSGSTGYEWYLDETYKDYFHLIKEDKEEILREGFVGTPVIRRWQLKAVNQGETELKFLLYRDWEGKDKAASLFKIRVKIL